MKVKVIYSDGTEDTREDPLCFVAVSFDPQGRQLESVEIWYGKESVLHTIDCQKLNEAELAVEKLYFVCHDWQWIPVVSTEENKTYRFDYASGEWIAN